jgi:hypothetical protein
MSKWILRETLASKRLGKPIYFQQMTGIGPMSTPNIEEAAEFETEQEAKQSPAYAFSLTFYEPEESPHAPK